MAAAGAVLTGGASRRMGATKALIRVGGVPMAERVATALLAGGCPTVVLVGGDAAELAALGRPVVADRWPGQGPLGGVLTALRASCDADRVVIAACDLPRLRAATVRRLLGGDAEVLSVAKGLRRHPSLAVFPASVEPSLGELFQTGERSMSAALQALESAGWRVADVAVDEAEMRNVNTPDQV